MLFWLILTYLIGFISGVAATISILLIWADVLEKAYKPYEGDSNYNGMMYYDDYNDYPTKGDESEKIKTKSKKNKSR